MVCCSLWQTGIEAVQPFSRLCAAPPASAVCMRAVATQQHPSTTIATANGTPAAVCLSAAAQVYWYTVEFGVVREAGGVRAFGAGILSSFGALLCCQRWLPQPARCCT